MSSATYAVRPGPPQQLTGAKLPANALLYNTDTTLTIYVSDQQAMSPANGMPVTPLGSISWPKDGVVWACLDQGVPAASAPKITISDNASNLTNPLAVGVATAQQINALGVPNVLVGGALPSFSPGQILDVSGFASVFLSLRAGTPPPIVPPGTGTAEPCMFNIRQMFSQGSLQSQVVYDKSYSMLTKTIQGSQPFIGEGQLLIGVPVRADTMIILGTQAGGANTVLSAASGFGTNRQLDDDIVTNGSSGAVVGNVALPAGASRNLPVTSANNPLAAAVDYFISSGGPATIAMLAAPAGASVLLYTTCISGSGGLIDILLGAFTALNVPQTVQLPKGLVSFTVNVPATAGTYAWSVSMDQ